MATLYLRRADAPERVVGPLSPDQLLEALPSGDDCVSLRPDDPYVPVEHDLDRDAPLRETLMRAFPLEGAERYARYRFLIFSGLVPLLLLAVLDAELLVAGQAGAGAALTVDLLSSVVVAVDLARRYPRDPHVSAAAFGAASLRLGQLFASRCGEASGSLLAFGLVAALASISTLVLSPTPRRMADHLRTALALAPPTRLPPPSSHGFFRYIVYAVGAAALLPAMLWWLRSSDMALGVQLLAFILFAWVIPYLGRVFVGREPPVHRDLVASALGNPHPRLHPDLRAASHAAKRIAGVAITSLVLSFALVRGAQSTVDGAARVQSCVVGQTEQTPALRRFVDAQRSEVMAARANKDPSWLLLTVVLVPVAEELVYRGLVQHALRRRLRRRWALGLAALLFGLAHVVAYRSAVYQPVLLGLSFGLAYERAGIVASILVHMLWNLWLSI